MQLNWKAILSILGFSKPDATRDKINLESVDVLLQQLVDQKKVPGLAIKALFQGEELFCRAYGYANLEKRSAMDVQNSIFRIASISKPITSVALASLVREGILNLSDDLRVYVPEFPLSHGKVTLRQLASHTAGIRSYKGKEFALNRSLSIVESLELFIRDPLKFPPGKGYNYTSFDFVLLSLAMERAVGKPFEELVWERVLQPLGMRATSMEIPENPRQGQVDFYSWSAGGFRDAVPVDTRYKLAGGGYLSTVADVCLLGQACLDGIAISREMQPEFLSAQKIMGTSTYYGLGWEVSEDFSGRPFYGHTGNAVGAYTNFKVFPKEQLVVCILVNASVPGVQSVLDTATEALFQTSEPQDGRPV